jgi:hypothetical protein
VVLQRLAMSDRLSPATTVYDPLQVPVSTFGGAANTTVDVTTRVINRTARITGKRFILIPPRIRLAMKLLMILIRF